MKKWVCSVCGYVYEGENPPEKCPQCGVPASKFTEQKGEMCIRDRSRTLNERSVVAVEFVG